MVLNEEEAGDDSFQRVYMQFKVTVGILKGARLRLKMLTFSSTALAATHHIPFGF